MKLKSTKVIVARAGKRELTVMDAEIRGDGTIWYRGMPVLGITDAAAKAEAAAAVRAKRWADIPAEAYTRLGHNPNGLWVGTEAEWLATPWGHAEAAAIEATQGEESKRITIILSSRGWGDYSPCIWTGDITRPDEEIMAECRHALATGHDVDHPDLSEHDLYGRICVARTAWRDRAVIEAARRQAEDADLARKRAIGYCFACESYCDGDCGEYSRDPKMRHRRELDEARRESYVAD